MTGLNDRSTDGFLSYPVLLALFTVLVIRLIGIGVGDWCWAGVAVSGQRRKAQDLVG